MKKFVAFLLVLAMVFSLCVPAFANTKAAAVSDSDYLRYTIDFTGKEDAKIVSREYVVSDDKDTVASAMSFVKSLELTDSNTLFIQEACLAELEEYRRNGVQLESYTVLVPVDRSQEEVLGTINGRTFYYTKTSEATVRIEPNMDTGQNLFEFNNFSMDDWEAYVSGAISIGLTLAGANIAGIAFSAIYSIVSAEGINGTSYSFYRDSRLQNVYILSAETRTIYTYDNNERKTNVRIDQEGKCDAFTYFCPVAMGLSDAYYQISAVYDKSVAVPNYHNNSVLLQQCLAYYNRGAQVRSMLSAYSISYSFT